jgi:hypothetical protein
LKWMAEFRKASWKQSGNCRWCATPRRLHSSSGFPRQGDEDTARVRLCSVDRLGPQLDGGRGLVAADGAPCRIWPPVPLRIPETLGFVLLNRHSPGAGSAPRGRHATGIYLNHLWRTPASIAWLCATLVVAGFLFTWWARLYLGPLWSSSITRKQDHRVVDTGPNRLVRHPIYTGILVSAAATTILNGTAGGAGGHVALLFAFYLKARPGGTLPASRTRRRDI